MRGYCQVDGPSCESELDRNRGELLYFETTSMLNLKLALALLITGMSSAAWSQAVITNAIYQSGETVVCIGQSSIETAGSVIVEGGADLTLISPSVTLVNGFIVDTGGVLQVSNN